MYPCRAPLGALSKCLDLVQRVAEDLAVTLELEVAPKHLLLQQEWKPQDVVGPHFAERYLVRFKPLRSHLCGEDGAKNKSVTIENENTQEPSYFGNCRFKRNNIR